MKTHLTSVRVMLCIVTVLFGVTFFSSLLLGSDKARPIVSLTADDRAKLPDGTQVTLGSGRVVSLGVLRAEHKARLERFSQAAALGRMAAGKLPPRPAKSTQTIPTATGKAGSPIAANNPAMSKGSVGSTVAPVPVLVPFHQGANHVPRDYLDFCKAASPSVCLYLPASTHFQVVKTSPGYPDLTGNPVVSFVAIDVDPLITDAGMCEYQGGRLDPVMGINGGCNFFYFLVQQAAFVPRGPVDTTASCNPPGKYAVDPKGEIWVGIADRGTFFASYDTGTAPVTCVVQVWMSK